MSRIRLTHIASIAERLDAVAEEIQPVNPVVALAIDRISDRLEGREAAEDVYYRLEQPTKIHEPKRMNYEQLQAALDLHKKFLENKEKYPVDLSGAILAGSPLQKENLRRIIMHKTNLNGANLDDADVSDANLQGSDLCRASMNHTNFTRTDLRNADLSDADIQDANFQNADLRGANFSHSYLYGTNLTGAKTQGANMTDIKTDKRTRGLKLA